MEPSTNSSPGFKPSGFQNSFGSQKTPKLNTVRVHPYNNKRFSNSEETNQFNRRFNNSWAKTDDFNRNTNIESKRCFMIENLGEDIDTRSEIVQNSGSGLKKHNIGDTNECCSQNFTCKQKCIDGTNFENNNTVVSKPVLIGMNSANKNRNGPLLETPKFPALNKKYISHPVSTKELKNHFEVETGSLRFGGNQFVGQTSPEVRRFPVGSESSGAALPADCRKICNSEIAEECREKVLCCTVQKYEVKCGNKKCVSKSLKTNKCTFERETCCCNNSKHIEQVPRICFQNGLMQKQGLILSQNRHKNPVFGSARCLPGPAYQIQPILTQVVQKCGSYRQNYAVHSTKAEVIESNRTNSIERDSNKNYEDLIQCANSQEVTGCDKSRKCCKTVEKIATNYVDEKEHANIDIANQSSNNCEVINDSGEVVDEEMFEVNNCENILKKSGKIVSGACSCNHQEQVVMPPVGMVLAPSLANNWNMGQPVWNFVPAQSLGRVVGDKVRF